ncbi:putative zinc transporter [Leishmania major strain Friedlin]|uniref:Putative zinc transporter n=1 Tax=Leishmania major TaxID=5664 RepID=Q4Q873_LEIMA|nr:putative zinc transporter [Leishmania major strain Friedlin]CAG9577303.1 Zinc_transporter_3_-_putative [Leishmania major strain Friedlin]CAJ05587.1 putative zinc transporter [Leishmania major strain Friedlin]|eukprot:XP_001684475.1 putative zinc transporter [Leishmania major strain Friedlin]
MREPLEFQSAVASATKTIAYSQGCVGLHPDTSGDGTRRRLSYAGSGHDHGHSHGSGTDGGHGHSHGCASVEGDYMLGLHIAAIFIILAASVVGTLIPIVGKRVPALRLHSYVYAVGKAAATGVVLAVAMIHMINHASDVFGSDCIPESFGEMYEGWAFLFAMIAAIVMHAIDGTVGWIAERWTARAAGKVPPTDPCHDSLCNECSVVPKSELAERPNEGALKGMYGTAEDGRDGVSVLQMDTEGRVGHQHSVAVPEDMPPLQRIVAALCMEFGVTLHSVFVGLALAVSNGADLRALIIALVFHQLFEGLAMGARLADASFKISLELALMLVFSFSAPIGIAAGTGAVMASRDALSGTTYALVSAILDSICGGIMLYIAFNLLFVDFSHDLHVHRGVAKRIGMYAGLWVGAAVMAIIGKWL